MKTLIAVVWVAIFIYLLAGVVACAPKVGWQVGFGVYPVTQIQNQQSLTPSKTTVRARNTDED